MILSSLGTESPRLLSDAVSLPGHRTGLRGRPGCWLEGLSDPVAADEGLACLDYGPRRASPLPLRAPSVPSSARSAATRPSAAGGEPILLQDLLP